MSLLTRREIDTLEDTLEISSRAKDCAQVLLHEAQTARIYAVIQHYLNEERNAAVTELALGVKDILTQGDALL